MILSMGMLLSNRFVETFEFGLDNDCEVGSLTIEVLLYENDSGTPVNQFMKFFMQRNIKQVFIDILRANNISLSSK